MKSSIFDVITVVTVMLVLVIFSGTVNPVMAQNAYGRQDLSFENDSGNGNGHDQGKPGRRTGHSDNMPGQRNGHRKDVVDQTAGDSGSGEGVSEPPTGTGQQGFQRRGFRKPPMRGFNPGQNNAGDQGNNECGQGGSGWQRGHGKHRRPFMRQGMPEGQNDGQQGFRRMPFRPMMPPDGNGGEFGQNQNQNQCQNQGQNRQPQFMRRPPMPFGGRGRCQPGAFNPGNNGAQDNNPDQGAKGDNGKHLGWRNRAQQGNNANIKGQAKQNNEGNGSGNGMKNGNNGRKGNNGLHLGWRNNGNQGKGAVDSGRTKQGNRNNGLGNARNNGKR
ncbi:MAG: hypothetical protein GQF41_0828 [Candidatus Rifleibacterium amylolyticum]|nr:MAG: hypothetical protein GQF41_0828 [Candidatus Rifleibacterium amylolyticum]NLF97922.1 hypothetical protein [Candidatus Riflebacteria bacterium]